MKLALRIPGFGDIDSTILPSGVPVGGLDKGNKIIGTLIEFALIVALLFALYKIAHAAYNMITSYGDKEKFAQGRNTLSFAIVGLLVIIFSFFIISILGRFFGVNLLGPN